MGAHGRESRQDEGFEPGVKSAFELNPTVFSSPARAQAVMFHELSHLKDYELTQRWVTAYENSGKSFVGGGVQRFQQWLRGKASPAEAQLASDIASGAQATTEARAYVRTFIAAFDLGAGVEAATQLVSYAKGMASGKIAIPAQGEKNPVVEELMKELAAYRRRLGRAEQKAFDAAVAAAVKENPKSWLAAVKSGVPEVEKGSIPAPRGGTCESRVPARANRKCPFARCRAFGVSSAHVLISGGS